MTVLITVLRVLASCTSLVMLCGPLPSTLKILRTKSTGVGSIVPLVTMFTNAHFIVLYGYMSEQYFPVFSTFVAGNLMSLTYLGIFYWYSPEKPKAHRAFLVFGALVILATAYAILGGYGVTGQTRHDVGQVLGYCTMVTAAIFYSSPMERVGLVLKHKSAAFLNIHMLCAGTINNLTWIVYTSLVREWLIFAPNAFCGFMGFVQIGLYWVFHPSTHPLAQHEPEISEADEVERGVCGSPTKEEKPTGATFGLVKSPLQPLH